MSEDLLKRLADPIRTALGGSVAACGLPAPAVAAVVELCDVALVVLLATVLARGAAALIARRERGAEEDARWRVDAPFAASALAACPLLWWILGHRSPIIHEVFARGDHLAFAALAGLALSRLPLAARTWSYVVLSLAFLAQYYGGFAVAVALGAHTLVFGALRLPAARRIPVVILLHVALVAVLYAACWGLRPHHGIEALQLYGIFSFLILRQISAAVAMRGGERLSLGGYLCYLGFYPSNGGFLGGPEVYDDFARRNLRGRTHYDYPAAVGKIARGALLVWLGNRLPASFDALLAASTTGAVWGQTLLLFFATAFKVMGFWALIEATALLFGFLLQPNFTGVLTRTNPSELWWAWRGTFANWLVRYVYGPLGANRRHQALNIVAAFAVSWIWHVLGLPFFASRFTLAHLAPITLWATLNATALIAHVHWQRRGWTILPEGTPASLRRATNILLTWLLAAFNVAPLQFQGDHVGRFKDYLLLLAGLR